MDSKKKIILKKLKNHSPCILHPESTLVFKSSQEKLVIGRYDSDSDEITPLDDVCLELCVQNNFKYDTSLVEEVSEDGSGNEEKQSDTEQAETENNTEENTEDNTQKPETPETDDTSENNEQPETTDNDIGQSPTDDTPTNIERETDVDTEQQTCDENYKFRDENDKFMLIVYKMLGDIRSKHEKQVKNIEDDYKKVISSRDEELAELTRRFVEMQNKFENIKKFMM